jgi:predicted transcriptional regulator
MTRDLVGGQSAGAADPADGQESGRAAPRGVAPVEVGRGRRRRAGELSGLVLDVLRAGGEALTPAVVQRRLAEAGAGSLAYTTVVTTLSRLHEHGLVERFRTGRAYAYLAISDPAQLAARRMRRVLDAETDRDAVLASFVDNLTGRDERLLRELLGGPGVESMPPGVDSPVRSPHGDRTDY